jgi:hypothetical protein
MALRCATMADVKGRRAADRRRERQAEDGGEEGGVESTHPGRSVPGPEDFDDSGPTAASTSGKKTARPSKTSITSVTNVGAAAKEVMREAPLEPTKVRALALGPSLAAGRLIVLEGRDVGKSFDLTYDVMVVGRAHEAHIKLVDPAVNRLAFEIRHDEDRGAFLLVALHKDPPPLLNGEEAGGSDRELSDGDVIEVAETSMRFVRMEGPAPGPREVPKPKDPTLVVPVKEATIIERTRQAVVRAAKGAATARRVIGLLVVLVVGLAVGGTLAWQAYSKASHEAALNDPNGAYQTLLKSAVAQRDSRRWGELVDTSKAVDALAPERGDGARLAEEARAEGQAERNLALGRMHFANNNHDAARSALRLIPETSVYKVERDTLLERVVEVGRSSSTAAIRELLAAGRYKEAMERAEQHMMNYPGDSEVNGLRSQAMRSQGAREAAGSGSWQSTRQKALQALDVSDFTQAISIVEPALQTGDRALASSFLERLRSLQGEWKRGRDLLSRKDAKAVAPLQKAKALEKDLSDGQGALGRDIARALADAHYLHGIDLLGAGKDCDARAAFDRANAERGSDPKVTDKLMRIAQKGREILGRADAARARGDKGEAARLGRDAACRLPKGDEDRARADKLAQGKG